MERFSEQLRPRAEKDASRLRAYLDGPMLTQRFGGLVTEWNDYLKLFREVGERKAIGEASVSYLWSKSAPANIRGAIPDARIILVLRNPVEMIFSMYLQTIRSGAIDGTFREAIETDLQRGSDEIDVLHPFLDFGFYAEQVQRYLEAFPATRRVYWYEDYQTGSSRDAGGCFPFSRGERGFSRGHFEAVSREPHSQTSGMPAADRAFLVRLV